MHMTEQQLDAYVNKARQAPRLTSMFNAFAQLADGTQGQPQVRVQLDPDLLGHDTESLRFAQTRARHAGVFNEHFVASLPYALEEQCRLGAAILRHARHIQATEHRPCDVYTLGDGPGVMARALAEHAQGAIRTLCCSPNSENQRAFQARVGQLPAAFFLGPFFYVTPDNLERQGITQFPHGFDLIIEDTTFQMYGRERSAPIQLALRNLRDDGIFMVLEKFKHSSPDEFQRRELQKDREFKARYLPGSSIESKNHSIVHAMNQQLVTLEEMRAVLSRYFKNAFLTWNSGNFSSIVAANHEAPLQRFIGAMTPPAIPLHYTHHPMPLRLLGQLVAAFRAPQAAGSGREALASPPPEDTLTP